MFLIYFKFILFLNVHDDAGNANGPQYGKDGGDRRW